MATRTSEQTTEALGEKLSERYRGEIIALRVSSGKHVCTGVAPKCPTCLVPAMCRQVGETSRRQPVCLPGAHSSVRPALGPRPAVY